MKTAKRIETLEDVVKNNVPIKTVFTHPCGTKEKADIDIWHSKATDCTLSTDSGVCISVPFPVAYHILTGELEGYNMGATNV